MYDPSAKDNFAEKNDKKLFATAIDGFLILFIIIYRIFQY